MFRMHLHPTTLGCSEVKDDNGVVVVYRSGYGRAIKKSAADAEQSNQDIFQY